MVKETKKAPAAKPVEKKEDAVVKAPKVEEPEPTYSGISLGTVTSVTTGRNKSGMNWKKNSSQSAFHKGPPITYLKSMELKAQMKRIRERV